MVTTPNIMDPGRSSMVLFLSLVVGVTGQTTFDVSQEIESFHVISDIRYRFATTQMVSSVRNKGTQSREISFDVTLPKEAFIMHFAMTIDGKVYEGEVKEKKAAKRQYDAAVGRGQSAGHVAQEARHANLFDVSVNVAAGSVVNFTLTYQELLRRKLGLYQHEIHVRPGQAVEDFLVKVFIKDKVPITSIWTPSVKKDYLISNEAEEQIPDFVSVVQRSPNTAYVEYMPSLVEQGKGGLNARFILQYDVAHSEKGDVMVVDGYFVHFYAPELPPMPKDIIFVLDKSGSMMHRKIDQQKTAMKSILKDLMSQDKFNIIVFNDTISTWKTELFPADDDIKQEAENFVENMFARGGTNINDALVEAVRALQKRELKSRAPLIFFLTDGQATSGVTDDSRINSNILSTNEGVVSIFSLAFGNDADYDLLKGISAQNSGFARKIYAASDSALQVSNLYKEISAVVAKDLKVNYLNSSVDQFTLTKTDFPVVFNGSEIVICGRLDNFTRRFEMDITATQKDGDLSLKFESNAIEEFVIEDPDVDESNLFNSPRDYAGIVERMWAFLSIKQMLKDKEKAKAEEEKAEELKRKIIDMAVKYKFVTPLTSMVVTKPEENGEPVEKLESGLTDVDDVSSSHAGRVHGGRLHGSFLMNSRGRGFTGPRGGSSVQRSMHKKSGHRRRYRKQRYPQTQLVPHSNFGGSMYDLGHGLGLSDSSKPLDADDDDDNPLYDFTSLSVMGTMTPSMRLTRPPSIRRQSGGRRPIRHRHRFNGWRYHKKGGRGRRRRTKLPKMILAVITMDTPSDTYCILPKRWSPGNYSLLEKPVRGSVNGPHPVLVEVGQIKKKLLRLRTVYLEDGSWVNAGITTRGWDYSTGPNTQISFINGDRYRSQGVRLEQNGKPVLTLKFIKGIKKVFHLELKLSADLGDGGSSLIKAARPNSGKRVIQWCGRAKRNFTFMGVVPGKKARKFKAT